LRNKWYSFWGADQLMSRALRARDEICAARQPDEIENHPRFSRASGGRCAAVIIFAQRAGREG
jgi:hypothetical protein